MSVCHISSFLFIALWWTLIVFYSTEEPGTLVPYLCGSLSALAACLGLRDQMVFSHWCRTPFSPGSSRGY